MKNNPIIAVVIMMIAALKGCTTGGNTDDMSLFTKKYNLYFDSSGFESEKTRYAAGEEVTVRYDIIATDTDYHFYSDDVEFTQDYDDGYVFTFTMPDHDVTLNVESHNSMEYIPDDTGEATLSFDSFDGGGPEFTVKLSDESLVTYQYKTQYASSGHDEMNGAGYSVIFTFSAVHEGNTEMVIEERSPIADNLDHHYMVYVDSDLNVTIEEGDVTETYAADGS